MTELRGFLVTSISVVLATGALMAAERPPQDLHLVGDHWTAWNPPESFPEGATVYTIVRGDTLWDLAARFYGDPYLWPQLWEQNRYILDAHWIYPGDPLLIDVEVTGADEYAETVAAVEDAPGPGPGGPAEDDPFRGVLTADQAAGPPVPLGAESDIYCSGFVGPPDETFSYVLIGSEHGALRPRLGASAGGWRSSTTFHPPRGDSVRYDLATGDVVYLDGGVVAGLDPGQVLEVVVPGELVHHPLERRAVIGRYYDTRGRVRVLSVQEETAIGEILASCDAIRVGAGLRLFEPRPVPLGRQTRMRPLNFPVSEEALADAPVIVWSEDRVVSMGQGNLVYIDRGAAEDVLPGDVFTIYRKNEEGLPPVVLGELAMLSVEDHTALGRIVESRYSVYVGDLLDRK
ncbi:MAG TPA: LysM peptidoglycan-binding domain-containing protein [Thermoanaerobaculia bacterium]